MLNNRQKAYLRAVGNHLKPSVMLGKEGISDTVIETLENSLQAHELAKITVLKSCPATIPEVRGELASATDSEIVQTIGRTILLYRRSKEPVLELPR